MKNALWEALHDVRDDMFYTVNASIGAMGYVYDVRLPHGPSSGSVEIQFSMPHRGRPMFRYLADPVEVRLRKIVGVERVSTEECWDPAWTPDRMDDSAWTAMGFPLLGDESSHGGAS
jgi:metal-sulfur cluster biosynthetic enzyme